MPEGRNALAKGTLWFVDQASAPGVLLAICNDVELGESPKDGRQERHGPSSQLPNLNYQCRGTTDGADLRPAFTAGDKPA